MSVIEEIGAKMPAPSVELQTMGVLIFELERLHPGITQRCMARAQKEAHSAAVIRLRGVNIAPTTRALIDASAAWFAGVSALMDTVEFARRRKRA